MSDKVVQFPGTEAHALDIAVKEVLEDAMKTDLQDVVIMGWRSSGGFFFTSSSGKTGDVLLLLETTKHEMMHMPHLTNPMKPN